MDDKEEKVLRFPAADDMSDRLTQEKLRYVWGR